MNAIATAIIRDVPLSKLMPSEKNVRRTSRETGIEELAASIAAHGLLQSLSVRPECDEAGTETGRYTVSGGGRRLAALKLLAKRKRIAKTYPVPCIVHTGEDGEASLAENVVRENLHPADQFEAFKRLAEEHGFGAEEIAGRFGVTPQVVRQRLRLGAVSPALMQAYRDGHMTLDQLMAFAITEDHARQEQVYRTLSWNRDPSFIRRAMMETHVRASDRRAIFVGSDAYQAAGGVVLRDLFSEDDGGYFADAALLDRLTTEKLDAIAADVRSEGWKWVEAHVEYPHAHGIPRHYPQPRDLSAEDQDRLEAAQAEYDALANQYDRAEELPEDVAEGLAALETEIERLSALQYAFDPQIVACGGAFVVLGHDGQARIERGFVRPEDAPKPEADDGETSEDHATGPTGEVSDGSDAEDDENAGGNPLSDLLIRDLSAHRTLGLRLALGEQPDLALLAVTHALAARTFYYGQGAATCLDIQPTSAPLGSHAEGIEDTAAAIRLAERHAAWASRMPADPTDLWAFIAALDPDARMALLAHCTSLTVFAVQLPWDRRASQSAAADQLAQALALDMTAHWKPTVRSYLGRVTKARIMDAVHEGVSEDAAARIAGMKKQPMAEMAEQLLASSGWLPTLLRTQPIDQRSE